MGGSLVFDTFHYFVVLCRLANVAAMSVFVCGEVQNETIRLDGWEVWFCRVSFSVACFGYAHVELRLFARKVRGAQHCMGDGNVPLGLTSCTPPS